MNSIAQELAGFYARPKGVGRHVHPLGEFPMNQREKTSWIARQVQRLEKEGLNVGQIVKRTGICHATVKRHIGQ